MPRRSIPVYRIHSFSQFESGRDFYVNTLSQHLKNHHFIFEPHKHDFYITMLFTRGSGLHEIDFASYPVKPGSVFFLSPGQTHNWQLSADCEGYIFFHSAEFYDLYFTAKTVKDLPFFASVYSTPWLQLKATVKARLEPLFVALLAEYKANEPWKQDKLRSLCDLIYIELSRLYASAVNTPLAGPGYLDKLSQLEALVDAHYKHIKFPKEYAERMNLSEKHLNRICRECLNKTTGDLIADRVIMEAKRLLIVSKLNIAQVAEELGYADHAYFSRFFKKHTGHTPLEFIKHYRQTI